MLRLVYFNVYRRCRMAEYRPSGDVRWCRKKEIFWSWNAKTRTTPCCDDHKKAQKHPPHPDQSIVREEWGSPPPPLRCNYPSGIMHAHNTWWWLRDLGRCSAQERPKTTHKQPIMDDDATHRSDVGLWTVPPANTTSPQGAKLFSMLLASIWLTIWRLRWRTVKSVGGALKGRLG